MSIASEVSNHTREERKVSAISWILLLRDVTFVIVLSFFQRDKKPDQEGSRADNPTENIALPVTQRIDSTNWIFPEQIERPAKFITNPRRRRSIYPFLMATATALSMSLRPIGTNMFLVLKQTKKQILSQNSPRRFSITTIELFFMQKFSIPLSINQLRYQYNKYWSLYKSTSRLCHPVFPEGFIYVAIRSR